MRIHFFPDRLFVPVVSLMVTAGVLVAGEAWAAVSKVAKYYLEYSVPSNWQPADSAPTDLATSITVAKFRPGDPAALVVVLAKSHPGMSKEPTVSEWLSAMRTGFEGTPGFTVEDYGLKTLGNHTVAVVSGRGLGTGSSFEKGSVATRRMYLRIPNGTDVIQFVLTAPAGKFSKLSEEMMRNLQVSFSGKPRLRAASTDTAGPSQVESSGGSQEIQASVPTATPPGDAVTAAGRYLVSRDWPVFVPITRDPPCHLVVVKRSTGEMFRTMVLSPLDQKTGPEWLLNYNQDRHAQMVILMRPNGDWGWMLPAAEFKKRANPNGDGGWAYELQVGAATGDLKPFEEPKNALSGPDGQANH